MTSGRRHKLHAIKDPDVPGLCFYGHHAAFRSLVKQCPATVVFKSWIMHRDEFMPNCINLHRNYQLWQINCHREMEYD